MKKIKLLKILLLSLLLGLNIFLFLNLYFFKIKKQFEIDFIDVGQGNSTLIKTESGLNILIDSGKDLYGRKNFYKNLSFFEKNIDLAFASHYDIDHVGNFLEYFMKYKIYYFFKNGKESKAPIYNEIIKILNKKKIPTRNLEADEVLYFNSDFKIKVLFPDQGINKNKLRDNSSSLVLQIIYKNKKFLIMGDCPKKIEKWLILKYGNELKSDVLLAGHHGSKTSSSEEFLKIVHPDWIIFSAGKNNQYHHPNKSVLDLVRKLNLKYLRTDEVGTIKFIFNGVDWEMKFEK